MKGIKQIGSMACTAMAVFLFSYSVSLSLGVSKEYSQAQQVAFSKSGKLPLSPDTQFPFEERDEESGDEFQDSFSMVCVPSEIVSFVFLSDQFDLRHPASDPGQISTSVPIYLAKRALLI
jgi:hypothetical protein